MAREGNKMESKNTKQLKIKQINSIGNPFYLNIEKPLNDFIDELNHISALGRKSYEIKNITYINNRDGNVRCAIVEYYVYENE